MGWFRSNRGGVAWLALFALACQLMLSFGHFHAGKFDGRSLAFAALETGDAAAAGTAIATTGKEVKRPCGRFMRHLREHQPRRHTYSAGSGNHSIAAFVCRDIAVVIDGQSARLT
jgi:hypothetical protein